jgi:cell division septation protein DedD
MRISRLGLAGAAALSVGALAGATTGTGEHVAFSPKTVTVGEEDGQAVVTVARDACQNAAFRLDWDAPHTSTNADRGTADAGSDYEGTSSLDWWESCAPGTGVATQVLTVPILDDDEEEDAETINMSLSARPTSTDQTMLPEVDPDGTIVIEDDDTFGLDLADLTVDETAGVARIPVKRRGGPSGEPVDVTYWTSDIEAKAGQDYTDVEGDLTFDGRGDVHTIEVPIAADGAEEDSETFRLTVDRSDTEYRAIVTIRNVTPKVEEQLQAPTQTQPQTQTTATTASTPAPPAAPRSSTSKKKRKCISKRRFSLDLGAFKSARVRVGDKPMKVTRKGGKLRATVDLRGNPKGQYTVKIAGKDASGKSVAKIRRYKTCAPRQDA